MGIERFDKINKEEDGNEEEDNEQSDLYTTIDEFLGELDEMNNQEVKIVKQEFKEYLKERGIRWD